MFSLAWYRYYPPDIRDVEEEKDRELVELARKYARQRGFFGPCLPLRGIVKLVMANCPTWKRLYGHYDPRGAGMCIGRRVKALRIKRVVVSERGS